MTSSNDLCRPAAAVRVDTCSTAGDPPPMGFAVDAAGGCACPPAATVVSSGVAGHREVPDGSWMSVSSAPDEAGFAVGDAEVREGSVGLSLPASTSPTASVAELRAAADAAHGVSSRAWDDFGNVCRSIARRAVAGIPLRDEDREQWRSAEQAWKAAHAVTEAAHAAWKAARYADTLAVGEGNSPDGIVRPVEAVGS